MVAGKGAAASAMEAAANIAASAKSGMDKTKAVVEEKHKTIDGGKRGTGSRTREEAGAGVERRSLERELREVGVICGLVEKMTSSDPVKKDMATLNKEDKIMRAEFSKQEAYAQNAAASFGRNASYTAAGTGNLIGHETDHVPAGPRYDQRDDLVTENVIGSHYQVGTAVGVVDPLESNTGTGRTPAHGPAGTTMGVDGSQYPVGENTGSGRTPVPRP